MLINVVLIKTFGIDFKNKTGSKIIMGTLTTHIAKRTMRLKDVNSCVSFVSTVWRDKPLLIMFNNLDNSIVGSYLDPTYQEGDIEILESLVTEFLT